MGDLDVAAARKDFPIYEHFASQGKPFTFLDSAASSQKPRAVQSPDTVEEHVAARQTRPPEAPIHRSDYRAPRQQDPGFLGAVVAIASMVAVLVGLAVAYFLLRKH